MVSHLNKLKMNIAELQQIAGQRLGLKKFTVPAELSMADRELLYDEQARFIQANPKLFGENWIDWGKKRMASAWFETPLESYSLGDAVQTFTEEFANQAIDLNNTLNPFSERNRKLTFWLLVGGAAIYFLAPVIVQTVAASKNAKLSPNK